MIRCYRDDNDCFWIQTGENTVRCIDRRNLARIDESDPWKGHMLIIGSEWPIDEVERSYGLTELTT